MKHEPFNLMLQGGDRRSIGKSNRVATITLERPDRLDELMQCVLNGDTIVRMRAADAAEKISAKRPELLTPFKLELLELADEVTQKEVRWHLALMIPRLHLERCERARAVATLYRYLADRSSIVKTFALQALTEMSRGDPEMEADVIGLLQRACCSGTPAMKARSRRLLTEFGNHDRSD